MTVASFIGTVLVSSLLLATHTGVIVAQSKKIHCASPKNRYAHGINLSFVKRSTYHHLIFYLLAIGFFAPVYYYLENEVVGVPSNKLVYLLVSFLVAHVLWQVCYSISNTTCCANGKCKFHSGIQESENPEAIPLVSRVRTDIVSPVGVFHSDFLAFTGGNLEIHSLFKFATMILGFGVFALIPTLYGFIVSNYLNTPRDRKSVV